MYVAANDVVVVVVVIDTFSRALLVRTPGTRTHTKTSISLNADSHSNLVSATESRVLTKHSCT